MKIIKSKLILPAFISAVTLFWGAACSPSGGPAKDGEDQVLRAFPESADIAMYFDQKAISESSFSEAVEELQEDLPDSPQSKQADEFSEKITEITGLEDDDITNFALAVSGLENLQLDASQLKISGGIFATKPVTAEQVVAAVALIAEQNGESFEMTVTVGDGVEYIEFPVEPDAPEIFAAVVTGESSTVVFFGDRASVEAALARESGSVPAALQAPSEGLVDGQQGWISFILPESFKAQLPGLTAQAEQMNVRGLSSANSLQSIGLGMKAAESLDVAIGLNLGSQEDAAAVESILKGQVISLAQLMLGGRTAEPLPLLESLNAAHEGDRAVLSLALTVKDVELLQSQLMGMLPTGNFGVTPGM